MTTAERIQAGIEHHRAGRYEEAAGAYSAALAEDPSNVAVLRLMGMLHSARGDHEQAVILLRAAATFAPDSPEIHNDLALALRGWGDHHGALNAFNDALRLDPRFAEAHFNKGVTLEAMGAAAQAADAYTLALEARPDLLPARYNRGLVSLAQRDLSRAADDLDAVRKAQPAMLEAHLQYARACIELVRLADAKKAIRTAIAHGPGSAEAHALLGSVYAIEGKFADAAGALTAALERDPSHAGALYTLGLVRERQYAFDEARDSLLRARDLKPGRADIEVALGVTARKSGRLADARGHLMRAVALDRNCADAHWHLADLLLLCGEYEQGWEEFEWRWKHRGFLTPGWDSSEPAWQGEPLEGKRILLYPEQGFGDTLHFVRYAPMVAARGAQVYLGAPRELAEILRSVPGIAGVVTDRAATPRFDAVSPLMSLPRIFRTRIDTIPARVPYLAPDPARVAAWASRLPDDGRLRVGLIWSGNPAQENNPHRACRLSDLLPLLGTEHVHFYSLQKGVPAAERSDLAGAGELTDLAGDLHDFADTAAALQHLDLLISTDTGPVHLAGALGRPVWLLVSSIPDWRWEPAGGGNRWYPTLRLFRQRNCGDWASVVHEVRIALAQAIEERHAVHTHLMEVRHP